MRRILAIVAAAAGIAMAAAGCSGSSQPVTYAPAAYGVPGHCYYIQNPAEAVALEAAGLCPHGWVPTLAPLYWQEEYYGYYSSPVYVGRYVPARLRSSYVRSEHSFSAAHRSSIRTASARAAYKGSDGTVVTGTTVTRAKARFGSGTTGTSYGGGKRSGSGTSGYSNSRSRSGTSGGSRSGTSGGSRSFGGGKR